MLDWFLSDLCGRRQCIRIENTLSARCNTIVGVPQGGVLSALLFAIFNISVSIKLRSSYHIYANAPQTYTQASLIQIYQAVSIKKQD